MLKPPPPWRLNIAAPRWAASLPEFRCWPPPHRAILTGRLPPWRCRPRPDQRRCRPNWMRICSISCSPRPPMPHFCATCSARPTGWWRQTCRAGCASRWPHGWWRLAFPIRPSRCWPPARHPKRRTGCCWQRLRWPTVTRGRRCARLRGWSLPPPPSCAPRHWPPLAIMPGRQGRSPPPGKAQKRPPPAGAPGIWPPCRLWAPPPSKRR